MRFRFMFMCVLLVLALTATYVVAAPIHDAAGKGDLAKVKALLKANPKLVNLAGKDDATPLHYAVAEGHKAVVEFLLASKADVNAKKTNGVTPLHVAAALGRTEIAKILLSKGADPNAADSQERTPRSLAEKNGHTAVVELLTGSGAGTDNASEKDTLTTKVKPGTKVGDVTVNLKDGAEMVWVPAGEFLMGTTDAEVAALLKGNPAYEAGGFDSEKPQRKVYLDGYWVYKYEVTVKQYRKFCKETNREMPKAPGWGEKDDHPMVYVSWRDAAEYAKWAAGSLPTEAQWEKAARGTDGRKYPWGSTWDKNKCANPELGLTSPAPVGSYPAGASPYGCMDMAGNVFEWCGDWYGEDYYKTSPSRNPKGPSSGENRVLHGGTWGGCDAAGCRCAFRHYDDPYYTVDNYGFRLVR